MLHKKDGFELNKDSRPTKRLSEPFRVVAKLVGPDLQHAMRALSSRGREFAGCMGGVAIGMRCMVMHWQTQTLAIPGRVAKVLLDVARAFHEVSLNVVLRAAQQVNLNSCGMVVQMLDVYTEIPTFMVMSYGLSDWHVQLGGLM